MTNNVEERDSVAALIRTVGRRAAPPRADYERVYAASRAAWQAAVRRRSRRRWTLALAAGVAGIALLSVLQHLESGRSHTLVATLSVVEGAVFAGDPAGDEWRWLSHADVPLAEGTRLRTDPQGRAALQLTSSASLRIAGATDLILHPDDRIELLRGRVYLDTRKTSGGSVEVVTRYGTLRDIGTQFEVLATNTGLRVRTREGAVTWTHAGTDEVVRCKVSEELRIDAEGRIERGIIAPYDAAWAWAEMLAEPPREASLPLLKFLEWVSRETGRRLTYDSPETRARVSKVILHGKTPDLAPVRALEVTLATTDIDFALLDDGTILLHGRRAQ